MEDQTSVKQMLQEMMPDGSGVVEGTRSEERRVGKECM